MRTLSVLLVILFTQISFAQLSFDDERAEMGPSYTYRGVVLKDIEIPGGIGRSWNLCYPRAIRVDIEDESPSEKKRITDNLVANIGAIKRFVVGELDDSLERSNQLFRQNAPRFSPLLVELYDLRRQRDAFGSVEYSSLSKEQKASRREIRNRIDEIEDQLFGVWNRITKEHDGGIINTLDKQRLIMDYSRVRFFHRNPEEWANINYERKSRLHDELRVIFRVQDVVTLGDSKTGIFSTGDFGDNVKSDYIKRIEEYVARSLRVSPSKVEVTGNKSMPANDSFCQGDTILFTQY